jgi:hypothetical protein
MDEAPERWRWFGHPCLRGEASEWGIRPKRGILALHRALQDRRATQEVLLLSAVSALILIVWLFFSLIAEGLRGDEREDTP